MQSSEQRKRDHISLALAQSTFASPFADFQLIHRSMPELALQEVDLSVSLFGFSWGAPLYINAMTGGYSGAEAINEQLGALAAQFELPVAVGSQKAALINPHLEHTFASVRRRNPAGMVWANLSAGSTPNQARAAIAMLDASALQLHLNAPQELAMPEGDRDFSGWRDNIARIAEAVGVPVIAKEVGFGIARTEAHELAKTSVAALDVGGAGGTDFLAIEQARHPAGNAPLRELRWGITTPVALVESLSVTIKPVFASGGVYTPISACIALALGASAVGLGRPLLKVLLDEGEEAAGLYLRRFIQDMGMIFALQGARSVGELQQRPVIITGQSKEWLELRGISPQQFARR